MLVLSRKYGEVIAIGDDIKIHVVQIKGGRVRIGIDAPQSTAVHRLEVYQEVAGRQGNWNSANAARQIGS
ncbi:MAG: carbon storage regulator CsrA [Pirellulaceae bacterium]